jgi:hypothetical protein
MPLEKKLYDHMIARFKRDTFKRIGAVLDEDESRADFVRAAVEREIEARESALSASST